MCKKIFLILTFSTLAAAGSGLSQEPTALFFDVSESSLNTSQSAYLNALKKRKTTATYKVVQITSAQNVKEIQNVILDLKPGFNVRAQRESIEIRNEDDFTWLGKIADKFSYVTLVVNPHGIYGTIWAEGELFRIESLGGDKHAIIAVDKSKFDKDHPAGFEIGALKAASSDSQQSEVGNMNKQSLGKVAQVQTTSQIDVFVAYTPAVAAAVSNVSGLIACAEAETNTSYQNSDAQVAINVVYHSEVDYDESGESYSDHLYWFRNDDAVDYMRNEVGADICVLLVDDDEANGLAAALGAEDETEAFCVVYYDAATGNYSFGHEIGHLLNAEHQREGSSSHARHGYFYQGTVWWRTIMATSSAGGTRIQYWSNPEIDDPYDAVPMGTYANENNVGEALNENAPDISDFLPTGNPSAPAAPSNLVIPNEAQIGENPELEWDASTTLGVNTYKVYRCENYVGSCAATLQVIATTSETNYTDTEIEITTKDNSDDRYRYHVTAVQFGLESADSNYEEVWGGVPFKVIGEDEITTPPTEFMLHQNYPNPFNPVTVIRYDIPEATHVRLVVYDIAGREAARLVDGIVEAGRHSVLFDATNLVSGVYIYKLEAGAFNQTARMILAK